MEFENIGAVNLFFFIAALISLGAAFYTKFLNLPPSSFKPSVKIFDLFFYFLIYFIFYLLLPLLLYKLFSYSIRERFPIFSALMFIISTAFFALIAWWYIRFFKPDLAAIFYQKKNYLPKDLKYAAIGWALAFPSALFTANFISYMLYRFFKITELPSQTILLHLQEALSHPLYFILLLFLIVIIIPIMEEFLFRGILQNFLKRYLKPYSAIISTSVIFAIYHFSSLQLFANISILSGIFVISFFLGFIYEKSRSLLASVYLHSLYNAASLLIFLFMR